MRAGETLKVFTPERDKTQYDTLQYRIRILRAPTFTDNSGKKHIEYFDWGPGL